MRCDIRGEKSTICCIPGQAANKHLAVRIFGGNRQWWRRCRAEDRRRRRRSKAT